MGAHAASGTDRQLDVGEIVGDRYVVDSILCVGGMSTVYRATHLMLERSVALKVICGEMIGMPGAVERFMREARAAANLDNEHIVEVHDVGKLADGRPYLALEHLEGVDLADFLAETLKSGATIPMEAALECVFQACEALAEVHARGIVHRDLKPANLFRTAGPDGSPHLKLIDFGISRIAPAATDVRLTQAGSFMGTPSYMAPEQMGKSELADARADIWSLGVILFELLAGKVPFDGLTPKDVLVEIMLTPRPNISELRRDVDPRLDAVITKCLQKEPSARFSSACDLARALGVLGVQRADVRVAKMERVASAAREKPVRASVRDVPVLVTFDATAPIPSGPPSSRSDGISLAAVIVARDREHTLPVPLQPSSRQRISGQLALSRREKFFKVMGGPLLFSTVLGVAIFCGRTLSVATSPEASDHASSATLSLAAEDTAPPSDVAQAPRAADDGPSHVLVDRLAPSAPPVTASASLKMPTQTKRATRGATNRAAPPPATKATTTAEIISTTKDKADGDDDVDADEDATDDDGGTTTRRAPPPTQLVIDGTPTRDLEIRQDDVAIAVRSGAPIPIHPGAHKISATVDGLVVWSAKVNIENGRTVHVRIPAAYAGAYAETSN